MRLRAAKDKLAELREMNLPSTVIEVRPSLFCEVGLDDTTGFGFARCHWRDEWNTARGTSIARGRALLDLAEKLVSNDTYTSYIVKTRTSVKARSPKEAALAAFQKITREMTFDVTDTSTTTSVDLRELVHDDRAEFLYRQVRKHPVGLALQHRVRDILGLDYSTRNLRYIVDAVGNGCHSKRKVTDDKWRRVYSIWLRMQEE